jgi:hypothetical protein
MIVHLPSMLTRDVFLTRHPVPHVVVGHFDEPESEPTGVWANQTVREHVICDEPGGFSALTWAIASLGLGGDCVARMLDDWSTVWLAFAREDDALRVCTLVNALPETPVAGECASAATFVLDALLLERLRVLRAHRLARIEAAQRAGEEVHYMQVDRGPLNYRLRRLE